MIGKTLAHYEITSKLGEGCTSVVYLAHDTSLDRKENDGLAAGQHPDMTMSPLLASEVEFCDGFLLAAGAWSPDDRAKVVGRPAENLYTAA